MTLGTGLGPFWVWNQLTDRKGHMKVDKNPQQIPATECATRPELSHLEFEGIWKSVCEFYDSAGELIACGYEAIVYGDHGHTWSSMRIRYTGHLSATTN